MMRISPRNWGSRSRTDEHGTILRRLGVSFIALVVSLASVLAMSVAAGACTTISATLSTTPAVIGTSATDGAKVSGTSGTPAGTVTFTLYSGTSPSGKLVTGYTADTVILTGGQATSASTGTLAVGSYYFMVSYSGNATYSAITGTVELFIITPSSASTTPKTGTSAYKIPTSAPQTGAGGSAGVTFNAGLLSIGSLMLLAGLGVMGFMLRRRRNA